MGYKCGMNYFFIILITSSSLQFLSMIVFDKKITVVMYYIILWMFNLASRQPFSFGAHCLKDFSWCFQFRRRYCSENFRFKSQQFKLLWYVVILNGNGTYAVCGTRTSIYNRYIIINSLVYLCNKNINNVRFFPAICMMNQIKSIILLISVINVKYDTVNFEFVYIVLTQLPSLVITSSVSC